jgi:hypothetical protein
VAHSAESIFFLGWEGFQAWMLVHYGNVKFLPYCSFKGCGKLFNEFAVILRCGK